MERTEERTVCGDGEGAEPCDIFFRAEDDLEGREAAKVCVSGMSVPRAVEQNVFFCVSVGYVRL